MARRVEPVLRFTLKDKAKWMFSVDRMTYRGDGDLAVISSVVARVRPSQLH
jgi:hypothetical protein